MVILHSVAGSDVDEAGTGAVFDERIAGIKPSGTIAEGVLIFELEEMISIESTNYLIRFPIGFLGDILQESIGNDVGLVADLHE
jgi:hypothetical protein